MTSNLENLIQSLNTKSTEGEMMAVLIELAISKPNPIILDKNLRAVATLLKVGLSPVKHTYDMLLKNMNFKPVDTGFTIAKEVLDTDYSGGMHLKLTKDGFFHAFEKTHWIRMSEDKIKSQLQEVAVKYVSLSNKTLHSLVNDALGSLKDYLGTNQDNLSPTQPPLPIINCLNGELWIGSQGDVELKEHNPKSQLQHCLPLVYNPEAKAPTFKETMLDTLSESVQPEEMYRHICEFMGYAIQPHRTIPSFWLLIGKGANGKTKFLQTLSHLISNDYILGIDMAAFGNDKFNTSQLQGKLVMIDDDLKMNTIIPDGFVKKYSESKLVSARHPYGKQSINFQNLALPIMAGNHYPQCNDLSGGLRRRAMVIPFWREFLTHEQDSSKFETIWKDEMSGVLNEAIAGYQRVVKRKHQFSPPKECNDAQQEFFAHGNPLYCFLLECLQKDSKSRITFKCFRQAYEIWAKSQNISNMKVMNKTLKRSLEGLGYTIGMYTGDHCVKGYKIKEVQKNPTNPTES
jgi:putative DNA primase/helicase